MEIAVELKKQTLEGKCIDGFQVIELKGTGGFSDVYKVQDNLGQIFAMKIVRDKNHAPLLSEEAKILAGLHHAQIPRAVRFGMHEDKPFLVMDYVPKTLQELMDCGKILGPDVAPYSYNQNAHFLFKITKSILSILDYTHSKGIVHKDLKPKNVGFDKDDEVVIYDFNIAKNLATKIEENAQETDEQPNIASAIESDVVNVGGIQKSVLGGTEGYSSPEQRKIKIGGKVHPVDQRSDVYTVGVMLYEMLVGNLPDGNYEKPSDKIKTPKWLDAVVDKALSQNPDKRYQSAREMLSDIKNGREGKLDAENKVVKYLKETVWPTTKEVAQTVGNALWKTAKFPFWVYGFGIPVAIDRSEMDRSDFDRNARNLFCAFTGLGTLALWAGTIFAIPLAYSSFSDKQFVEELKKGHKGTIVCEEDGKIRYFSAKDALQQNIHYTETATPKLGVENLIVQDGVLYFTGNEKEHGHALYSLNLRDGTEKKIFDLSETLNNICKKAFVGSEPVNETETAQIRTAALKPYALNTVDAKIKDFSFSKDADKRIILQIGKNWYSVNKDGEDFKKENMAVMTSTKADACICPDGQHYLSNSGAFITLTWNGGKWGGYVTPVKGSHKMWIDFELPEQK